MLPWQFYRELQAHRLEHASCDTPMLIIHGDADDTVPYTDILDFSKTHPNAKLFVVKGADHRFKKTGELDKVIGAAVDYWKL